MGGESIVRRTLERERGTGSNLDKPCQEENESYKIEVGAPARETVNGSVHKEHPALLGGSLIHGEDTGT